MRGWFPVPFSQLRRALSLRGGKGGRAQDEDRGESKAGRSGSLVPFAQFSFSFLTRCSADQLTLGASRTVATVLSTPGESSVKSFASRCPAPSPLRFGSPPAWRRFRSACQACGLAPPARLSGCRPDAPYSAYPPCCSACSSGEDQVCRRRGGRARAPCTCRCFSLLD